jgi:nucleotide-binding universal stress UspA family protein
MVLVEAVQPRARSNNDLDAGDSEPTWPADENLLLAAYRLRADGLTVTAHVSHQDPVAATLDAAQLHHADLIVMATHGRSGLGRMVYGSVADQVLRHAEVPVLLVPSMIDHTWPTDRPLTVLVPLDGSAWSEAVLGALDTLLPFGPSGADLLLLRTIDPPFAPPYGDGYIYAPSNEEAERAGALSYLDGAAARLAERGYTTRVEVTVGRSSTTIASVARDRGVDLIAMATHGRSGLARAVLGSTATATIQRAGVPILLTRPTEARSAQEPMPEQPTPVVDQPRTDDTSVMVLLTPGERDLVQSGLEQLLAGSEREGRQAAPIRAILARIADTASDRTDALAATAR